MQMRFLKRMNQHGNIWAFLTIAVLALIFVLLLTRHQPIFVPQDLNTESRMNTLTMVNMMRALRQGIQAFSSRGFSTQSNLWVCNVFMPPLANEIDSNGSFFLKGRLNACFKTLTKAVGYSYDQTFNVSLNIATKPDMHSQIQKMFSLPDGRVDVNVSFVVVGASGKYEKRKLRNSYALSFPYRIWQAYKKYFEWGQNYLQIMGRDTCNALKKTGPCLFIAKGDPTYQIMITDKYIKSRVKLNSINLNKIIGNN